MDNNKNQSRDNLNAIENVFIGNKCEGSGYVKKTSQTRLNSFKENAKRSNTHKNSPNEKNSIHIPLVKWFRMQYPALWRHLLHIPNEGKRSIWQGSQIKLMGVVPGASDLFLSINSKIEQKYYGGFWIELKAIGKKPTAEQKQFLLDMRLNGYMAEWFDDLGQAIEAIKNYLQYSVKC